MYENILVEKDVLDKPHRIFSLDEAGLGTDPIASKVFVPVSSILKTNSPRCSPNNLDAISNVGRKRKKVQAKVGEVLTSEDVATRLFNEEKAEGQRNAK